MREEVEQCSDTTSDFNENPGGEQCQFYTFHTCWMNPVFREVIEHSCPEFNVISKHHLAPEHHGRVSPSCFRFRSEESPWPS